MVQISRDPALAEQEILRLMALCVKLTDEKAGAYRELFGSRYDHSSQKVRLEKEIADLTSTASARHSSLLFERQAYKKDILDLELRVRDLSVLNESVKRELLQTKAKLCSASVQDSRLEREVTTLTEERQRLMADLDYARRVIRDNHRYALELEKEHYKCKVCRRRYDPRRPCLFDGTV